MWARMQERGIQIPRLKGQEMADIVAYLYVSHYFEQEVSPSRGQQVLTDKGCLTCHATRGQGGRAAADLATYRAARSGAALIAALWNHPRYLPEERLEAAWLLRRGPAAGGLGRVSPVQPPRDAGTTPRTN